MASIHEHLSKKFSHWELRGRGYQVFDEPVSPEPPFVCSPGNFASPIPIDDGIRTTAVSSFLQRLSRKAAPVELPTAEEDEEPEPELLERRPSVELQISLPRDFDASKHAFEQFLKSVSLCHSPLSFELVGLPERIAAQFAVDQDDVSLIRKQMEAAFPAVTFLCQEEALASAWNDSDEGGTAIIEFGLAREFMFPLAAGRLDPFIGIVAALSELNPGELGLFQIIFQPVRHPWNESIVNAVTNAQGKPFFINAPELTHAAEQKAALPLYAAVVRIAARAEDFDRTWKIAHDLASALQVFAHPAGNELIPLRNDEYPPEAHEADLLLRQTRRSGMILTIEELVGFVHLPSSEVQSPKLAREVSKTKAAPKSLQSGILLGHNTHAGRTVEVRLSGQQRVRHTHIIGASGKGKSTLLLNLIRQDIESGQGVAVLDPHGDLIDAILSVIPESRFNDVIVFDPSDENYSIGFNVLSAHSDLEKNLLASDLVSVFQRLSTSWGDQMGSVLQNAILAFLESSRGGTLADLRRFLLEKEFRNEFLQTVNDPEIVYYWHKGFPQLSGNKSIGSVLTRLETFLAPKPIRYMVSQPVNRLDFREIMDTGKVFLAKLPQGQIGKENAFLLGSLLMAKFQQTAMSRQSQETFARKPFWLYLDEFQNFITPSMAEILTGARKYNVGLILAHQELRQLERNKEVASAVLSNCHTRVVFGVGDEDARKLAEGFSFFEARDLQNLDTGHAICRVERSDHDFNLSVPLPQKEKPAEAAERQRQITTRSREKYATKRADIEAMFSKQAEPMVKTRPAVILTSPEPLPIVPKISELPKLSEVPKTAELITEQPHTLGRGGEQHKTIQERIQSEAHILGFFAEVESQLAKKSNQAADLVLRKGDLTIAVEITVTTTIDHEFGNVKKCLDVGFTRIAVVSPRPERLKAIADAVQAGLGADKAGKVGYYTPDEFIAGLRKLAEQVKSTVEPSAPQERVIRGYKVRRQSISISPEELRAKEAGIIRVIAEAMQRKS
jgi:hypothetical protein